MITFYPEKIEQWEKSGRFDFTPSIQLITKTPTDHIILYDRDALIGFCKQYGFKLDDPNHPLKIEGPCVHPIMGPGTYAVHQKILIGWMKDDFKGS